MPFFTCIAAILALVSLLLFIPVLAEYNATGLVPRIPTLVVSGFFMVAALLVLAVGMILDSQRKRARQNFELQMNILASIQHLRDEK